MTPPSAAPLDDQRFAEPWHATVWAMVEALKNRGVITPSDWAQALGQVIDRDGDNDGSTYYDQVLRALESLLNEKALVDTSELQSTKDAWVRAYTLTPHGRPVELSRPGQDRSDRG